MNAQVDGQTANGPVNPQPVQIPTPDIVLVAAVVERIFNHLNNPSVWVRTPEGTMHGFVDPMPIITIVRETVFAELHRQGLIPPQPVSN